MTGTRLRNVTRPANLQLYGNELSWVSSATHIGHELHQDALMEHDCKCKRARFIDSSTSIRESFEFAKKEQLMNAIQIYCSALMAACCGTCSGRRQPSTSGAGTLVLSYAGTFPGILRFILLTIFCPLGSPPSEHKSWLGMSSFIAPCWRAPARKWQLLPESLETTPALPLEATSWTSLMKPS